MHAQTSPAVLPLLADKQLDVSGAPKICILERSKGASSRGAGSPVVFCTTGRIFLALGSSPGLWFFTSGLEENREATTSWPANQCLSPAAQICMDSLDKYELENVQLPNIKVWASQAGGKEERVEGVFLKPNGETKVAGGCFLTQMKGPCNMLQSFHLSPFKITIL